MSIDDMDRFEQKEINNKRSVKTLTTGTTGKKYITL